MIAGFEGAYDWEGLRLRGGPGSSADGNGDEDKRGKQRKPEMHIPSLARMRRWFTPASLWVLGQFEIYRVGNFKLTQYLFVRH